MAAPAISGERPGMGSTAAAASAAIWAAARGDTVAIQIHLVRTTAWIVMLQQNGVINGVLVWLGILSDDGRIHTHAYPEYVRATGVMKNFRCKTCIDATAELADFSFGDAWLKRFIGTKKPWSIYINFITRNSV